MTPDLLREAGEALFGTLWQSELARALGVNDRTVRRWLAGGNAIPVDVGIDLCALLNYRTLQIAEVRHRLLEPPG